MSFNANVGDSKGDPFGYVIPGTLAPFTDTTGRTQISPSLVNGQRTGIFILDGQSLAASHCACGYTVQNPTKVQSVNWAGDQLLYQHQEPCFGGSFWPANQIPANNWSFPYTSVWGMVGDLLINAGVFDRIIFLNYAAGGQKASAFIPGGTLGQRIPVMFHVLNTLGYPGHMVSGVISMLGEGDGASLTDPALWKSQRREAIRVSRSFGFAGPWLIPQETYSSGNTYPLIRTAQAELAAEIGNVLGPDFDALGSDYRGADNIHPNLTGRNAIASMWFSTISANFTAFTSTAQRLHYR